MRIAKTFEKAEADIIALGESSQYSEQAQYAAQFLGVTLTVVFDKHGKHFDDDKDNRDIYKCTLERNGRKYTFDFGQSIAHSGKYIGHKNMCLNKFGKYMFTEDEVKSPQMRYYVRDCEIKRNPEFEVPNMYSILTCLQKYEVGSHENFCADYGYEVDSIKGKKVYEAVLGEYNNMQMLFSNKELELLQNIS